MIKQLLLTITAFSCAPHVSFADTVPCEPFRLCQEANKCAFHNEVYKSNKPLFEYVASNDPHIIVATHCKFVEGLVMMDGTVIAPED